MEYRILPHGGEKISVIGLGAGSLTGSEQEMTEVIDAAIQNGINYFDIAPAEQALFCLCKGIRWQKRTDNYANALRSDL